MRLLFFNLYLERKQICSLQEVKFPTEKGPLSNFFCYQYFYVLQHRLVLWTLNSTVTIKVKECNCKYMCKYALTVFYFLPSCKKMQKLQISKINGNSALKWAASTCISQFSRYPVSVRLMCGYDWALDNLKCTQGSSEETCYTSHYTVVFLTF